MSVRQALGNATEWVGDKLGIKEGLWSETIAGGPTQHTSPGFVSKAYASEETNPQLSSQQTGIFDQNGNQIGSSTTDRRVVNTGSQPSGATNNRGNTGGGNTGGGDTSRYNELKTIADQGNLNPSQKTEFELLQQAINQGANNQQGAAEAAAEARRKAAESRYNAQVQIAGEAKGMAKKEYDWLIDTIGSNKKDLLSAVATQETQGLADYATQEEKTKRDYDSAKQEILSTYRDLQTQQEKILRGSGMGSSSRSQEAALKLSNLLGKDISTVRTNEADSIALIGNAVGKFQESIRQTNIGIESEANTKLGQASLDYDKQIKAIDANLTLSAAEREEAYANAEAQLATDTQAIQQWATGLTVQAQQTQIAMQSKLDDLVNTLTDENGMLNSSLDEKKAIANKTLVDAGFTPMETNPTATEPTGGVYQKAKMSYKDKDSLDAALQSGDISPLEYNQQLNRIQSAGNTSAAASSQNPLMAAATNQRTNPRAASQNDPILSAMFA